MILTDEFVRQAVMETELVIDTTLFAPPNRAIIPLGRSQTGFINTYGIPLFQGVADIMPAMAFCIKELNNNMACWVHKISVEETRIEAAKGNSGRKDSDDNVPRDDARSSGSLSLENNGSKSAVDSNKSTSQPESEAPNESSNSSKSKSTSRPALSNASKHNSMASEMGNPPRLPPSEQLNRDENVPVGSRPTSSVSGSRMGSRPVTWDEGSLGGSRPATSASGQQSGVKDKEAARDCTRRAMSEMGGNVTYTQRRSETTDGTTSVPSSNDWTSSQGTSTHAGKTDGNETSKVCPSTARTSVNSSEDRLAHPLAHLKSVSTPDLRGEKDRRGEQVEDVGVGSSKTPREGIRATMRNLTRKPSKSRFMLFWKKKSAEEVPPVPAVPTQPPKRRSREAMTSRG